MRLAQAVVKRGLARIDGDRRLNPLDRQIRQPVLMRQHAHQMLRRGVPGINRQDLAIDGFGLCQSPLLMVRNGQLERGG